jgi:hypothetical protein
MKELLALALAIAATRAGADELAVAWSGGAVDVWEGRVTEVSDDGANGGAVIFLSNECEPAAAIETDRIFRDGNESGAWEWFVICVGGPVHERGICTMSRDDLGVILDCAADRFPVKRSRYFTGNFTAAVQRSA